MGKTINNEQDLKHQMPIDEFDTDVDTKPLEQAINEALNSESDNLNEIETL